MNIIKTISIIITIIITIIVIRDIVFDFNNWWDNYPWFFVGLMVGAFAYLIDKRAIETIRGTALLMGIFFTFISIIIGLYGLDLGNASDLENGIKNLQTNIIDLLKGIWSAFITSVVGMGISLITLLFPKSFALKEEEEIIEEDIVYTDQLILKELKNLNKNISGDGEASINTQLQKLRLSFDDFSKQMIENNMEALIEALEKVIKDFNTNLQEQFGENFKQLNLAVGKLLKWQENYKNIVTSSEERLKATLDSLDLSKESLTTSEHSLNNITEQANKFNEISKELEKHLKETKETIGNISNFSESLNDKPEEISKNMKKITENSLNDLAGNLKGISEALVNDYESLHKVIKELSNSIKK